MHADAYGSGIIRTLAGFRGLLAFNISAFSDTGLTDFTPEAVPWLEFSVADGGGDTLLTTFLNRLVSPPPIPKELFVVYRLAASLLSTPLVAFLNRRSARIAASAESALSPRFQH